MKEYRVIVCRASNEFEPVSIDELARCGFRIVAVVRNTDAGPGSRNIIYMEREIPIMERVKRLIWRHTND